MAMKRNNRFFGTESGNIPYINQLKILKIYAYKIFHESGR